MSPLPTEIVRDPSAGLKVSWDNGEETMLTSFVLRQGCPCAQCKASRGDTTHDKPLTGKRSLRVIESTTKEQTNLLKVWPVGNYALGMEWADGHSSGIYTFDYLYSLTGKRGEQP